MNIFISYRSSPAMMAFAQSLRNYLKHYFRGGTIFQDINMVPSTRWGQEIRQSIAQSDISLVLIDDNWLNAKESDGSRRLDNPDDWVRKEIEWALDRSDQLKIVPVRVNHATMPTSDDLPESLRRLPTFHNASLYTETLERDAAHLARSLGGSRFPWPRRRIIAAALLIAASPSPYFAWDYYRNRITEAEAKQVFESYLDAWRARDSVTMIQHIGDGFNYVDENPANHKNRDKFIASKSKFNERYAWIHVKAEQVRYDRVRGNTITVSYFQNYENCRAKSKPDDPTVHIGYRSSGQNVFTIRKSGGIPRIVREEFEPKMRQQGTTCSPDERPTD